MDVHDGSPASAPAPAPPPASVGDRLAQVRAFMQGLRPMLVRARDGVHHGLERLKQLGAEFPHVEQFIDLSHRVGFVRAVGIVLAILTPVAKWVVVPHLASSSLETWAQAYGVEVSVRDWSADLFDLKVTAHEVVVTPHVKYSQPDLVNVDNVVVDLSAWRRITRGSWVQLVKLEGAQLTFERLQTGHWNWSDVAESDAAREAFPAIAIPHLIASDLRVRWVEHLRGASGSGIVNESLGTIHLDDAELSVSDLVGPDDPREAPSTLVLRARAGDGKITVEGNVNVFRWGRLESPAGRLATHDVAVRPATYAHDVDWTPNMKLKVDLDNVGAAAMGRMMSGATFVPVAGYVSGDIVFLLHDRDIVDCQTNLEMRDVKFTVNEPVARAAHLEPAALAAQLAGVTGNGTVAQSCNGSLLDPSYRTLNVVQAALTRESMKSAPPAVRAVALGDVKILTGGVTDQALQDLGRDLGADLGATAVNKLLGKPTPKAPAKATNDNVAKKSWRGIKKVFGH